MAVFNGTPTGALAGKALSKKATPEQKSDIVEAAKDQ
jgi:hypothetical protein